MYVGIEAKKSFLKERYCCFMSISIFPVSLYETIFCIIPNHPAQNAAVRRIKRNATSPNLYMVFCEYNKGITVAIVKR